MIRKSIFFPAKHKRLARIISIKSPAAYKRSIKELKKDGLTLIEKRALVLAKSRARVFLNRKHLSIKERKQFKAIVNTKLPKLKRNG